MAQKSRKAHLSASACTWLEAAREAIRRHDGGMVVESTEPATENEPPSVKIVPLDDATDSAVIAHVCAAFVRWADPDAREAAMAADRARAMFIDDLENAWRGK